MTDGRQRNKQRSSGPLGRASRLQRSFHRRAFVGAGGVYCNTASYGLPPRPAWEALQSVLAHWARWEYELGAPGAEQRPVSSASFGLRWRRRGARRGGLHSVRAGRLGRHRAADGRGWWSPTLRSRRRCFRCWPRAPPSPYGPLARLAEAIADGVDAVAFSANMQHDV